MRAAIVIAGVIGVAGSTARVAGSRLALTPPVLEPFDGRWHTDTYYVEGTVDTLLVTSYVRVLRNGVVVDSALTATSTSFRVRVGLEPGVNLLTAVRVNLEDTVLVTSPPSNTVTVRFDTAAGLFIPVPMAPGASFDLNAVNGAIGAGVRVFDLAGDLVLRFESTDARTFYSFPWDGRNSSGERIRRGPLIAVGTIDYPDGTHEVIRRAFLFDPEASP